MVFLMVLCMVLYGLLIPPRYIFFVDNEKMTSNGRVKSKLNLLLTLALNKEYSEDLL